MRAMLHAGQQALTHLATTGETGSYADRLLSWTDRQALFGLDSYGAIEDALLSTWSDGAT